MSTSTKVTFINTPLCNDAIPIEKFVEAHLNEATKGKLFELLKVTTTAVPGKATIRYPEICIKMPDGKYNRPRFSFVNQISASTAKPCQADDNKKPKFCMVRFRAMKREEI